MTRAILILTLAMLGCTETVQLGDHGALAGLVSLVITPGDETVEIRDLSEPPVPIEYTAVGTFADGTERDVTALVAWRVDNPAPGNFTQPGHYETSQRAAGHATVSAIAGSVTASASLHVVVTLTIVDSAFPPPLGADALFGPETPIVTGDAMRSPVILYPSDGTMFPQGLARILFQHRIGQNNNAVRLTFESDVLHLTVYTGADRWQPDGGLWSLIAASHPSSTTTLVVSAASTLVPGNVYASAPARLSFSRTDPGGAMYYWSAATNGVHRTTLGAPTSTAIYPASGATMCVGCHVVSRDGRQMAFGYGGETLQSVDVSTLSTTISAASKYPMGWATFSPDNSLLLVADKGDLVLRDATSGGPVGSPDGRISLSSKVTHPDWSPDGAYVAVTLSGDITNMDVKNGAIARIPYNEGVFGTPEILVPGGPMNNNYFPRWSPDGKYIAYVNATTTSRGAASAELRLIRADGGQPVTLARASHRVGGIDDIPNLANTMPCWGPATGESVTWLAFASSRAYGAIMPNADRQQVWMAAVDFAREGDPSFAAFWLPSQDVRVINNNPVWAVVPDAPTF